MKLRISLLLLSLLASWSVSSREVLIQTVNWPPYYAETIEGFGPVYQITHEAFALKGYSTSVQFIPWKRALQAVAAGDADMVLGAYDTPQRQQTYRVTNELVQVKEYVVGSKDNGITQFNGFADLKGYKFGIVPGYVHAPPFEQAGYLDKVTLASDIQRLKMLVSGRIDFYVQDASVLKMDLKQIPSIDRNKVILLQPAISELNLYNLISRHIPDSERLEKDFNSGLDQLKKSGRYQQILNSYGM